MASTSASSSTKTTTTIRPIHPVVKDYAWGIRGMDSRVARYALESKTVDEVDPDCPYAELWIGTHPKGPAVLGGSGENGEKKGGETTLKDAIGKDLPFLLKVLSSGKALSIQAHPDKEGAKRLHTENPGAYGDANHKPEMAIALTPFEAMCGFRRLEEIAVLLKKHVEFANCISQEAKLAVFLAGGHGDQRSALQMLFTSFMGCPEDVSSTNLKHLIDRLQAEQSTMHPHPHDEPAWERKCSRAILRLSQQFPGDAGAMAPLFLNYLLIAPGESFFMAANEPHAYVAGEILECMACSDNVVRAGLTPKYKDVDNLVSMLTYSMGGPSIDAGAPCEEDHRMLRYTPPVPEFEILMCTVDPGESMTIPNPGVPAVMIIVEGSGTVDGVDVRPGRSYYWPAATAADNTDDAAANDDKQQHQGGENAAAALVLSVKPERRGPLKVAIAHENCHLSHPTAVNREDFGLDSLPKSPMPFMGLPQHASDRDLSADAPLPAL